MSIEQHGETPEHKAKREANTKRMETQPADLLAGRTVPPSTDLCACGHGRAMHFDEDGDHNGPCLWQVHSDAPFCKCDMWHRKPGEDEFLGVPVSEWNQIAAEINCRRGPDGSLLKRFRELLEVSDMRAALLKKRSAQGVDVEAASRAIDNAILLASVYDGVAIDKDKVMADLAALRRALTRADEKDERASGKEPAP